MSQQDCVTRTGIVEGLARLGVCPPRAVMVHGSLSRFGRVDGGAATVVDALREAAGADAAVVAPSFRDAIRSDHYALRECRPTCPRRLCPSRERGFTGVIGETVREQPDALRSCHPTHSWVGVGGAAESLLSGHWQSPTPCGRGSPFFRLMRQDGVVVLLGVGVAALTNIHAVEDARNVPYLSAVDAAHRHATYTTSGRRLQYRFAELLEQALVESGIMQTTTIGAATCRALPARDLGSFLWIATEDDPWCLVLRPDAERYDPAEDARRKTGRMTAAWAANPDRDAWRALLAASERSVQPVTFTPTDEPRIDCPAYRGQARGYHRCAANDLPPWEKFEDYPPDESGVATCGHCNWPPGESASLD